MPQIRIDIVDQAIIILSGEVGGLGLGGSEPNVNDNVETFGQLSQVEHHLVFCVLSKNAFEQLIDI